MTLLEAEAARLQSLFQRRGAGAATQMQHYGAVTSRLINQRPRRAEALKKSFWNFAKLPMCLSAGRKVLPLGE